MKKLYSLAAAFIIAASVNAQGSENFNAVPVTAGTSYGTVNFNGEDDTTWALTASRIVDKPADYNIENRSALVNSNGIITVTFSNGVGNLKFQYKKAFTGGTERKIEVSVDGTVVNTTAGFGSGSGAQTTVYNYSYDINKSGSTVVVIKVLGAQTTLDNFVWTANATMATVDANASKASLVKNTIVSNNIIFGTKADIQIINMNGQVVKTASVSADTKLDVSSLAKGIYVVTGVVNGKAVSQKIVKK